MNIVFQLLQKYFTQEQYAFGGILVLTFVINILQTNYISSITSSIIDTIEHRHFANAYSLFQTFIAVSVVYLGLLVVNEFLQIRVLTKLTPWMRVEFFKYIIRSNNEEMTQQNAIKYSSPVNRVSYSATSMIHHFITNILSSIVFVIIISGYFLYKNPTLGGTFFFANIALITYIAWVWEGIMYYKNIYEDHLNMNELTVIDMFNNFDKIIYRGQAEKEIEMYSERAQKCIESAADFHHVSSKHQLVMTAFIYVIILGAIWYLIRLREDSQIDTKVFITFFTILLLYRDKITSIMQTLPNFLEFNGRIKYCMEQMADIRGEYSEVGIRTYRPVNLPFDVIRFENVSYKYKTGNKNLFEKLSLTIRPNNNIVGITGVSGRGKSTIMKLLLKLHEYSDGEIYIDEVNIREIDPHYIRENITYVNQSAKLFDKPVMDNLLYGCKDEATCAAYLDIIMRYPGIQKLYQNVDFHNTKSGLLGEGLSGGQRQVVNILSGLVNPSKILILDEPTNALDLGLKTELIGIIDSFRKYKKCIIIISHDRDVYPLFDERIQI